ncbi:MAG: ATP-binding protein [Paludibacter sp.]
MSQSAYIPRPLYFDRIAPYIAKSLIKFLTGQRRVGKSYVLLQIMDEIRIRYPKSKIIYINKEDYQFESIKNQADLMEYLGSITKLDEKCFLFIDEIQEIANFEIALRSLQAINDWDIYCTGSNASLLSGDLATYLSGRYIQIRIFSLTYSEYLQFHALTDSTDSFQKYIRYGGMPHLINLIQEDRIVYEYLHNIIDTIVLRDIISRYNVRNVRFLQDLMLYLADITGSIVSAKRISDYLKSQKINLTPKLVLEYLSHFESVYFVDRVKRKEIEGRKIFEVGDKFYFEDIGMRHALLPFQQKDIGKVLESIVYHQLRANAYTVYVGKQAAKEIDFIAERNNEKIYIQVCYLIVDEATHQREFGNLLAIHDNCPKYVVSMDETAGSPYKGIEHLSIRQFLLNTTDGSLKSLV